MRKYLERKGLWDDGKENEAREGLRRDVMKAFKGGEEEKKPPIRELFTDIYEEMTEESKSQREELRDILERYPDEYDVDEYEGGRSGV